MLDEKIDKIGRSTRPRKSSACRWARSSSPIRSASISASMSATCCARNSATCCRRRRPGCAKRSPRANSAARPARAFTSGRTARPTSRPAAPRPAQPTPEMIDRLILPMSNVCVACLREGIVDNADVVDGAMIFGTGYAPFRGGPLNYARTRGPRTCVSTLARAGAINSAAGLRRMPAGRISSDCDRRPND